MFPFCRVVETLVALMFKETKAHIQNYSRFKEDYGPGAEEKEDRDDKLSRPEDFLAIFKGDSNEDFKLGLKVTKHSLKVNMHNETLMNGMLHSRFQEL